MSSVEITVDVAAGDLNSSTITYHPGVVTLRLARGISVTFVGPDIGAQIERHLNVWRFQLDAQVAERGGT